MITGNESYIRNVIEAALLAAGKPLQAAELAQLFDDNARPTAEELRAALDMLAAEYSSRGIEIKETAAGFRIQVRRELANEISRLWPERPARYSRALLETLALIAYRQPITRAEIEAVRGVAVNPNIVKTVIERNWVRVVGHRDVPGRPELLGTTREFLDYFGLKRLDELPPLAELKAMGDVNLQLDLPDAPSAGAAAAVEAAGTTGAEGVADAEGAVTKVTGASSVDGVPGAHSAAGEAVTHGNDATASDAAASDPVTAANTSAAGGVDDLESDDEAERTLSAAEHAAGRDTAADTHGIANADDDAEAAESASAGESAEAAEASGDEMSRDEDAEDDELSAEGDSARELVAGPRGVDD